MTQTITWAPGTNTELDKLYDQLREAQHQNTNHRLHKNYSKENFSFAIALTIYFNEDGNPELCSSIANRDCWPTDAYRILNRLWKVEDLRINNKGRHIKMSAGWGETAASQIDWLQKNTDYKLYFCSREKANWEKYTIKQFANIGIQFKAAECLFLTCPNECDVSCWQRIIYNGDPSVLNQWKHRQII
jgi:hypothetical protein